MDAAEGAVTVGGEEGGDATPTRGGRSVVCEGHAVAVATAGRLPSRHACHRPLPASQPPTIPATPAS